MIQFHSALFRKLFVITVLLVLGGCASIDHASLATERKCLLFESHEKDGKESVALQFEAIDGQMLENKNPLKVLPSGGFYEGGYAYKVNAGARQVVIRVYTRGMEARHNFHVKLEPGHTYRVAGEYGEGYGKFFVKDATTGARLTDAIQLQFMSVGAGYMMPILIPTK